MRKFLITDSERGERAGASRVRSQLRAVGRAQKHVWSNQLLLAQPEHEANGGYDRGDLYDWSRTTIPPPMSTSLINDVSQTTQRLCKRFSRPVRHLG